MMLQLTILSVLLCLFNAEPTSSQDLAKSINNFSLDFYKQAIKTANGNGNVFCSGYSLSTVLSMLLVGARRDTATEIQKTLGYQGLSEEQVENAYHDLLTKQRSNSKGYQLDVANSVWIMEGFNVSQAYKNTVKKVYYAEEDEVAFGTEAATNEINKWVSAKTSDKIPRLFDSTLPDSTRLVLVNAMYFKGTWKTKFNQKDTTKQPFYLDDGKNQKSVEMMTTYSSFPYTDSYDINAQILELPYNGNDVSMMVILPKANNGLSTLETMLTESNLATALNQMYATNVHVKLPKFNASSSFDLNAMLQTMGIKKAFGNGADFSGIDGKTDLHVSKAIQKAVVEVNEEGTEAAAASAIAMEADDAIVGNEPQEIYFTADHPFLYILQHKPTGILLFMGRTTSP